MNCANCGNEVTTRASRCPTCGVEIEPAVEDIWDDPIWSVDETTVDVLPSQPEEVDPPRRDDAARPPRPRTVAARLQERPAPTTARIAPPGDATRVMAAPDRTLIEDHLDYVDDDPYGDPEPDERDLLAEALAEDGRTPMPWVPPVGTGLVGLGWALLHLPEPDAVGDPTLLGALAGTMLIGAVLAWGFNRGSGALGALAAAVIGALPMLAEVAHRAITGASPDMSATTVAAISVGGCLLVAVIGSVAMAGSRSVGTVSLLVAGGAVWAGLRMTAADALHEDHRWAQAALAAVLVTTLASGLQQSAMAGRRFASTAHREA